MYPELIQAAEQLGVPFAVVVVLIVFIMRRESSYLSVVSRLADLVENNTKAMVSFADLARENSQALAQHDGRTSGMGQTVNEIYVLVEEIDEKVSRLLSMVRGVTVGE